MDRTRRFRNTRHYRLRRTKWNGVVWFEQFETDTEALLAADTHGGRPEFFDRRTGCWRFMRTNAERG